MGQAHSSGSDDTAPEKSQPVKKQKRSTKISAGNQEAIVQSKPPQSKRKRERQSKGSLPKRRRQDSDTKPKKSKQSTVPQPKQSRNTQPKRTKQTKDSQPRKPKQSTQSKRRPKQSTQSKRTLKQSTQSKRRLKQSGNSQPKNKKLAKNAQSKKPKQPRNTQQNKASDAAEIRDDLTACCTQQARDRGVLLTVKVEDEEQIEDELDDDRIKVEVKEEDEQYINTDDPLDINQLTSTGAEDVIGLYTNAEDAAAEEGSQSLVPGGSGVSNQQVCSPTTNWEICETRTIKGKLLQRRWKSLRECFRRELKAQKGKSGDGATNRKKYIYFDQLLFLTNTQDERATCSNYSSLLNNQAEGCGEGASEVTLTNLEAPERPQKRRKMKANTKKCYEEELIDVLKNKTKEDIDEDQSFLMSLHPRFKKLNDDQRFEAQIEILKIMRRVQQMSTQGPPIVYNGTMPSTHTFQPHVAAPCISRHTQGHMPHQGHISMQHHLGEGHLSNQDVLHTRGHVHNQSYQHNQNHPQANRECTLSASSSYINILSPASETCVNSVDTELFELS